MGKRLSQDTDYYDMLRTKLGDLQGADTLIHELSQNAHDAYCNQERTRRASKIVFDIQDAGLRVWNDGVFRSCGQIEADVCAWQRQDEDHERCDFHRFRNVAGGDKARAEGVFGAFGVGFISVYQITDQPEFWSSGLHWVLNPALQADDRIYSETDREGRSGTEFWLPWAPATGSELGPKLRRPSIEPAKHIQDLERHGPEAATQAIMFLENIESIEILRNGSRVTCISKMELDDELVVDRDGVTTSWLLVRGEFDDYKQMAKERLGGIVSKRSATVTMAIPEDPLDLEGLLFCGLPTRQPSQLPFHVNAHFFPSSDRKHIDLQGESYQVDWNLAALEAAAGALSEHLLFIRERLGHSTLWGLLSTLHAQGKPAHLQEMFWTRLRDTAAKAEVLYTSTSDWVAPTDAQYLVSSEEEANLPALESLELDLVHPDLRPFQRVFDALGVRRFGIEALSGAVASAIGNERVPRTGAHPVLGNSELRGQLGDELERLLDSGAKDKVLAAREQLGQLAVCLTMSEEFASPRKLIAPPSATDMAVLEGIGLGSAVAAQETDATAAIRGLAPENFVLRACQYATHPAQQPNLIARPVAHSAFFEWLHDNHLVALRDSGHAKDVLLKGQIWPDSKGQLRALSELVVPGGFTDSLGLAETLDTTFARGLGELATAVGASQLSVENYAIRYVPTLFSTEIPPATEVSLLLKDLASRLDVLTSSSDAQAALARLPFAECSDQVFRRPNEVLFDTPDNRRILGKDAALCSPASESVRSLLAWLGASDHVSGKSVLSRIRELAKDAPTPGSRNAMRLAFIALAGLNTMSPLDDVVVDELRRLRWLPARGHDEWHRPDELLTEFRRKLLFGDHGMQLDIDLKYQRQASSLLDSLHLRNEPTPDEAADYLEELLEAGETPGLELYAFFNRNAESTAIRRLLDLPLFVNEVGHRYEPDRAFLGPHEFGVWAITLDGSWYSLTKLLDALEVKRVPDATDAARILAEIEYELGEFHERIGPETLPVVQACWKIIGFSEEGAGLDAALRALEGRRVAPNKRGTLERPGDLLFDDQPELGRHLSAALGANLIGRSGDSWRGMAAAGTMNLSEVVSIAVETADDTRDATEDLFDLISTRRHAVMRALAQDDGVVDPSAIVDSWLQLECIEAARIEAGLTVAHPPVKVVVPSIRGALLDRSKATLYVVRSDEYPAAEVARELLTATEVEAGHLPLLVTAIERVLLADDESSAQEALDDRGFAKWDAAMLVASGPTDCPPEASDDQDETPTDGDSGAATDSPESNSTSGRADGETRARKPQRETERLQSYVVTTGTDASDSPDGENRHERNLEIDRAGTERVMSYERSKGRHPEKMAHLNKGFDIRSEDDLGNVRFIEVKSTVSLWGADGVGITPAQHDHARRNPDEWWLYVVEAAESEADWAIYCVNNFVERTYRYMFDDGWRVAAKEKTGNWKSNEASLKPTPRPKGTEAK